MIAKCSRCHTELEFWNERTGELKIFGGVAAKLCSPCHTEVLRFTTAMPEAAEATQLQVEADLIKAAAEGGIVTSGGIQRCQQIGLRLIQLTLEAHPKVKAFVYEHVAAS